MVYEFYLSNVLKTTTTTTTKAGRQKGVRRKDPGAEMCEEPQLLKKLLFPHRSTLTDELSRQL